jgi:hypothetical protein
VSRQETFRRQAEGGSVVDVPYDEAKFTELVLHVADRLRNDRARGPPS